MIQTTMNQTVVAIMDAFEELLDSKGIEIPCEDENEQNERHNDGNVAKIYGTEYWELFYRIDGILADDNTTTEGKTCKN